MKNKKRLRHLVGMSHESTLLAEDFIIGQSKMLEWGSGGSTIYFSSLVDHYVSIEHSKKWAASTTDAIGRYQVTNCDFYYVPLNDTKYDADLDKNAKEILHGSKKWHKGYSDEDGREIWGFPYEVTRFKNLAHGHPVYKYNTRGGFEWHKGIDYINKPLELKQKDPIKYGNYDVILVDGRCRQFCAYVARYLIKDDGYLLFDDFKNREQYHGILKWWKVIKYGKSLAVLQKKKI